MTEEIGSSTAGKMNYTGNSDKLRQGATSVSTEREPVKKIVDGKVIERKKPLGRKIAETFSKQDAKEIAVRVINDVLIPRGKDMIFDAFKEGLQRSLYGNGARASSSSNSDRSRGTSYQRFYTPASSSPASEDRRPVQVKSNEFKEIVLDNRGEAEEVLDGLLAILDQYKTVSVHELKEMLGVTGEFTDQKWGWKDLRQASVSRIREGYLLDLPRPVSLD